MASRTKKITDTTNTNLTEENKQITEEIVKAESVEATNETTKTIEEKKEKLKRRRERDPHDLISVRNNTQGQLIYISKKTMGYTIIWDEYNSEEYIEYGELMSMRNTAQRFFQDNWIMIDDIDVLEDLAVMKYYEATLGIDNLDNLFKRSPQELEAILIKLPKGMQVNIAQRAREMKDNDELYDTRIIKTLENTLDIDLTTI
jgi:hypothetical protein